MGRTRPHSQDGTFTAINLTVKIEGEQLARLRAFQIENGFPSVTSTARAMLFAALEEFPAQGIQRGIIQALVHEIRTRFLVELFSKMNDTRAEIEQELAAMGHVVPGETQP